MTARHGLYGTVGTEAGVVRMFGEPETESGSQYECSANQTKKRTMYRKVRIPCTLCAHPSPKDTAVILIITRQEQRGREMDAISKDIKDFHSVRSILTSWDTAIARTGHGFFSTVDLNTCIT